LCMIKIIDRLWIGDESDCKNPSFYIVHACKFPCHKKAVGYAVNPDPTDKYYLYREVDKNLFLNIIDPEKPLFKIELFTVALDFIEKAWSTGDNTLIHCNHGDSRSPSIAMVFLAKRLCRVPNTSYKDAFNAFCKEFHVYHPGHGISSFLGNNWSKIK